MASHAASVNRHGDRYSNNHALIAKIHGFQRSSSDNGFGADGPRPFPVTCFQVKQTKDFRCIHTECDIRIMVSFEMKRVTIT